MRPFLLILMLFSAMLFAQQSPMPPPLPALPNYPALTQATAQTEGDVYFTSTSPGDYKWLIHSDKSDSATTVKARLYMPATASEASPAPAMVILHGSGGILESRELAYGKWLQQRGIAALVIDSYGARGVTEHTPYALRVAIVSDADEVADAYSALMFLNQHPAINHKKIGLMGFSYGGMATRAALDKRIQQNLAATITPFALHLDYYGPCHFDLHTQHTTGAPLYSLRGGEDGSNDLAACAELESKLRFAGSLVGSTIFASAGHAWEMAKEKQFVNTLNPAPCYQSLLANGDWQLDDETIAVPHFNSREQRYLFRLQLLGKMKQSCMSDGYVMGQDQTILQQSNKLLSHYIDKHLLQ